MAEINPNKNFDWEFDVEQFNKTFVKRFGTEEKERIKEKIKP